MIHVDVLQANGVNILQHFIRKKRLKRSVSNQISDNDVTQSLTLCFRNSDSFVVKTDQLPHTPTTPGDDARFILRDGVSINHLTKDGFKLGIRGERGCCWRFLKQGFNKITTDVFFLFIQLRFQAKPENLSSTFLIAWRFIDVDKDRFFGNVNQVERALFLGITVEWTVVNWT